MYRIILQYVRNLECVPSGYATTGDVADDTPMQKIPCGPVYSNIWVFQSTSRHFPPKRHEDPDAYLGFSCFRRERHFASGEGCLERIRIKSRKNTLGNNV